MSIFLGEKLTDVVQAIVSGTETVIRPKSFLSIGVSSRPPLARHDSDRNRTSPFAFTGNKFEFRAVGSSQSISTANAVLNVIVADSLVQIAAAIEHEIKAGKNLNEAVRSVVRKELRAHEAIIFNGNSYANPGTKKRRSVVCRT